MPSLFEEVYATSIAPITCLEHICYNTEVAIIRISDQQTHGLLCNSSSRYAKQKKIWQNKNEIPATRGKGFPSLTENGFGEKAL